MSAVNAQLLEGYLHPDYAGSLTEFGQPRHLPASGAWLLARPLRGSDRRDAMSCYPLLFCANWPGLGEDLEQQRDLISVTAVTDPFANASSELLQRAFPDLMRPYKEHLIVELDRPTPSRHHRTMVRRALRAVEVEQASRSEAHLADWERIYGNLCARHGITGIRAFSQVAFRRQLAIPGCVTFRALVGSQCVAMNLWYVIGDVAYGHLLAADDEGYRRSAAYALVQTAISSFAARGLRHMVLGAGAGQESPNDGLVQFKRGWATGSRQAYLCGRILDRPAYASLVQARGLPPTDYFPAYRQGEFDA